MKIRFIFVFSLLGIICIYGIQLLSNSESRNIFSAVDHNDSQYVVRWLSNGGNPNSLNDRGESLLYIATGPHGGHEVLEQLLQAKANPDLGVNGYTPLMNASSWVDLKAVDLLLKYGANPNLKNKSGGTAYNTVGLSGGGEDAVKNRLLEVMEKPR